MGRNREFRFKQFTIVQEKSAMKVGTDGVLLGAWADVSNADSILDIGTGTGLIALMAAQRSKASITAVEIEENACSEAMFNISQSPWKERIVVQHSSFQEFADACRQRFDLVISNPPFFENDKRPASIVRSVAKHAVLLSFSDLISGVLKILNENGKFAIILPAGEAARLRAMAGKSGLRLIRITEVKASPVKKPHRCLMEFGFQETIPLKTELVIESSQRNNYTDDYKALTRDFYLAF